MVTGVQKGAHNRYLNNSKRSIPRKMSKKYREAPSHYSYEFVGLNRSVPDFSRSVSTATETMSHRAHNLYEPAVRTKVPKPTVAKEPILKKLNNWLNSPQSSLNETLPVRSSTNYLAEVTVNSRQRVGGGVHKSEVLGLERPSFARRANDKTLSSPIHTTLRPSQSPQSVASEEALSIDTPQNDRALATGSDNLELSVESMCISGSDEADVEESPASPGVVSACVPEQTLPIHEQNTITQDLDAEYENHISSDTMQGVTMSAQYINGEGYSNTNSGTEGVVDTRGEAARDAAAMLGVEGVLKPEHFVALVCENKSLQEEMVMLKKALESNRTGIMGCQRAVAALCSEDPGLSGRATKRAIDGVADVQDELVSALQEVRSVSQSRDACLVEQCMLESKIKTLESRLREKENDMEHALEVSSKSKADAASLTEHLQSQLEECHLTIDSLKDLVCQNERELSEREDKLHAKDIALDASQSRNEVLEMEKKSLGEQVKGLQALVANRDSQLEEMKAQFEKAEEQRDTALVEFESLQRRVAAIQAAQEYNEKERKALVERLSAQCEISMEALTAKEEDIENLVAQVSELKRRLRSKLSTKPSQGLGGPTRV